MFKVLIVEDEDIIRKGIACAINWTELGYVIVGEAADGEEGMEQISALQPDVVITDIKMPKMDGITMLSKAREAVSFKSIVLTSYAEFHYAQQAIAEQVFAYFLKPIDEEKLYELMLDLKHKLLQERQLQLLLDNHTIGIDLNYYYELAYTGNELVAKTIQVIQTRYAEKISIEKISDELGVSASYLSRKFKEIVGRTFLDFLNQYRVQQGAKLLKSGEYKVYEISELTGFSDYKHFQAIFKKYMLTSPTNFKKARS
ncbi:MAG: response regulator [Oscillospiraceae bacterium]|nr:response regulator [Oscillospiraceae bacterium]